MKTISRIVKEVFEFNKGNKKMPYDECLKMLANLKEINHSALNKKSNKSIIEEKTYLLGIKDCCLQVEILIEATVDDHILFESDNEYNPIDNMLKIVNENIAFNKIVGRSEFVGFDQDMLKAKYKIDGIERSFSTKSIKLNENQRYYNALKSFCSIAGSIDGLEYHRSVDEIPNYSIALGSDDFSMISRAEVVKQKVKLQDDMEMKQTQVMLIRPVLVKDKRLKWTIAFNPILPDNLVIRGKHDYEAYVKDDEYISWNASGDNPGYKNGDSFICDITYSVHHQSGDFFASIKNVVLSNVKRL